MVAEPASEILCFVKHWTVRKFEYNIRVTELHVRIIQRNCKSEICVVPKHYLIREEGLLNAS